ncbi:MAG: GIY-YIG nuclease family protein [Snowella sp.]|nr:GIY-YIG nuclease family protein [Snowella sp.]
MAYQIEYIYVLTNPSYENDLLKIGMTTRSPMIRARELSRDTGVPNDFIVAYTKEVIDAREAERRIHHVLRDYAYNKEFFKIDINLAVEIIELSLEYPDREYSIVDGQILLKMSDNEYQTFKIHIEAIENYSRVIEELFSKIENIYLDDSDKKNLYPSFSDLLIPIYGKLQRMNYKFSKWSEYNKYSLGCNILTKRNNQLISTINDNLKDFIIVRNPNIENYFYYYLYELLLYADDDSKVNILKMLTFQDNIWLGFDKSSQVEEFLFDLVNHKNIIISFLSIISLLFIRYYSNDLSSTVMQSLFQKKMASLSNNDKSGLITILHIMFPCLAMFINRSISEEIVNSFLKSLVEYCHRYNLDYELQCFLRDMDNYIKIEKEYKRMHNQSAFYKSSELFDEYCNDNDKKQYIKFLIAFQPLITKPF